MYRCVLLLSVLVLFCSSSAFGFSVSEVSFRQMRDDNVEVRYRLEGVGKCRVELLMSRDGGVNYTLRPRSVRGDVGEGVEAGGVKRIVWDVLGDFPRLEGEDIVFKVVASKKKEYEFYEEIRITVVKTGGKFMVPSREERTKLERFVVEQMYKAGKVRHGASYSEAKEALFKLVKEKGWRPEIRDGMLNTRHYERIGVIFNKIALSF